MAHSRRKRPGAAPPPPVEDPWQAAGGADPEAPPEDIVDADPTLVEDELPEDDELATDTGLTDPGLTDAGLPETAPDLPQAPRAAFGHRDEDLFEPDPIDDGILDADEAELLDDDDLEPLPSARGEGPTTRAPYPAPPDPFEAAGVPPAPEDPFAAVASDPFEAVGSDPFESVAPAPAETVRRKATPRPAPPPPEAAAEGGDAWLRIVAGPVAEKVYPLGERAVVGRSSECEVSVRDLSVSRRHTEVRRAARGGYEVRDLGSRNGTRVDGRSAPDWTPAGPGALIVVGDVSLRLELSQQAAETLLRPSLAPAAEAPAPPAPPPARPEPAWNEIGRAHV